jgi:pyridoxal biosynthesis lyase PdxS
MIYWEKFSAGFVLGNNHLNPSNSTGLSLPSCQMIYRTNFLDNYTIFCFSPTPADASLMRQLGAETVFVGSGIFKSSDPEARAQAIVLATTHYDNPQTVLDVSNSLGDAMPGLDIRQLAEHEMLQGRGV